jgi:protease PrsW
MSDVTGAPAAPPPTAPTTSQRPPPRWAVRTGLFQPGRPGFWLFVLLLGLSSIYMLFEQALAALVAGPAYVLGWLLLLLYIVPVVLVVRWLDLYEREPPSLLIAAFLWGGVIATTFSGFANGLWGVVVAKLLGPEQAAYWSAALTAPPVEELYKFLGLALLLLIARAEFDDLMDGFVYGALVGLGFTVFENIYYFVFVFGGGIGDVLEGFYVRVIASGLYTHVLFTGLSGIGLAYYHTHRFDRSLARRLAVVAGLLLLAMAAHFVWNSPWLNDLPLLLLTAFKGSPFLIALVVLLRLARSREHDALRRAVALEAGRHGLLAEEAEVLTDGRRRRDALRRVAAAGGPQAARLLKQLHAEQIKLAIQATAGQPPEHAELIRMRAKCQALRRQLWQMPGVTDALGIRAERVADELASAPLEVWQPTTRVGAQGGWAWATPDLNDERRAPLYAGMPVRIVEMRGEWARVEAENGWQGWTGTRYLLPPSPQGSAPG